MLPYSFSKISMFCFLFIFNELKNKFQAKVVLDKNDISVCLQFINLAQDNSGAMKEFASSSSIDIQQILNISAEDNTNLFTTFAESEFNLPN